MVSKKNAVATQNASVEMNKKVEELEFKLNDALVLNDIYWSITKNGKHLISTEEEFRKCLFAITDNDYSEIIKKIDLFKEDRGKFYLIQEDGWMLNGWKLRYENKFGISIVLTISQLFCSPFMRVNEMLDKFDELY